MTESVSSDEDDFSEDEETTDDDDDYDYNSFVSVYFYEEPSVDNLLQPLVPEDVTDDYCGAIQFIENFLERYEVFSPIFFEGSLGEAIEEALFTIDDEPKLMVIYLHHVLSVCSNVFCSQVLCSELVSAHLSRNFIVWGWDMTAESNRKSLLKIVEEQFGFKWRQYLENIGKLEDDFPLMLVFNPCCAVLTASTSNIEVIWGKYSAEEVMRKLIDSVDRFRRQRYLF